MMFAILFVHKDGGAKSVVAPTIEAVQVKAAALSARWPGSYITATVPYEVHESALYPGVPCTSLPTETGAQWSATTIVTKAGATTTLAALYAQE